jgi:hypothetical protein
MSMAAELVLGRIQRGIAESKRQGGNVNRVTTTPAIRRAILTHLGGALDGELVIDGAHVIADAAAPADMIYLQWWEA